LPGKYTVAKQRGEETVCGISFQVKATSKAVSLCLAGAMGERSYISY